MNPSQSPEPVDAIKNAPPALYVIPDENPVEDLLASWQTWMQAEGLADRTVNDWPAIVRRAAAATGADPTRFTQSALIGYLAGFTNPNTKSTYHRGLAAWHAWLTATGRREDNPMTKPPKVPRGTPHPISTAGLERLLSVRMHRRTRAMILLGAYQGFRCAEIAAVRGEALDLDVMRMRMVGKGGHEARPWIHPLVAEVAAEMPLRGWWFPAPGGQLRRHIAPHSVSCTISQAMVRAGVSGTAHSLRHWHATALLEAGADAVTVQRSMRHKSLATTQIYTGVSDDRLREAINRLPQPRAGAQVAADPPAAAGELAALRAELAALHAKLDRLTGGTAP